MKRSDDSRQHSSKGDQTVRAKQEAKAFELGMPLPADQYLYNRRELWEIWKRYSKYLQEKRVLSYADGDLLLELCEAELNGQAERKKKALAVFSKRKPFPAPVIAGAGIEAFIAKVREERESFPDRLRPDSTLCFELDSSEFDWPEGHAASIARRYAADSVGSPDCGELVKQACARFLENLETGHTRGCFFDPVAVRNVVTFVKEFGGLPNVLPWEVFVIAAIFGFKKPSGLRVCSEAWLSIGRKNGKTRCAASIGLFLLVADLEPYAEVYCAASAKDQARICWRDARRVVSDNAELAAHVTKWAGELNVKSTDSKMQPLASEERSFLGVRASAVIADEIAVWEGRDAWDALIQSQVSKAQPLILAITTAPEHALTFAFEKFTFAERVIRGIVKADHVFAYIARIDDGDDPLDIVKLRKANPSLGTILPEEQIAKQIAELSDNPSGLNNFIRFHANVTPERTLQRRGSITAAKWDACGRAGLELIGETDCVKATQKFLSLNEDSPCFLGLDIGLKSDLSAIALLFPKARFAEGADPIEKKVVVIQSYMPEVGVLDKERIWGVPLSTWARSAFLDLLAGDMVDPREIQQAIVDFCTRFQVREIGYDPWQFSVQAADLNSSGISCVGVPQVPSQVSAPCMDFLGSVNRGDLVHFCDPLLAWNASNVIMEEKEKSHGGCKPEKAGSNNEKIDGISAIINAWHRMLSNPVSNFKPFFILNDGSIAEPGPNGLVRTSGPSQPERNQGETL